MAVYRGNTYIEFGVGDIGITNGKDQDGNGFLFFENLKDKYEIGTLLKSNTIEELFDNSEIIMSFNNVESIDNFIEILIQLKLRLLEK